ncbi:MAG: hypothetical protein LUI06_04945 [Ruminococcus sp.]|nr:hypothetical protein [Ruminococcus sp.]
MLIPNFFLERYKNPVDLMIACKLQSMIGSFTKRNSKGYELSIKEQTLAKICGCSIATVRRSVSRLHEEGLIISMHRRHRSDGLLGAYIYTIKDFNCTNGFFALNKRAFADLTAKAFYLYAWFCRLKGGKYNSFYQSLNDLSRLTGWSKSKICSMVNELISKGLILKQRKRTKSGDYTDNTYFVVVYIPNKKIYKKSHRLAKTVTQMNRSETHPKVSAYNNIYNNNTKRGECLCDNVNYMCIFSKHLE